MTFNDFLVGIGVIVSILVPFALVFLYIGVTKARLKRLEDDIKELKTDVKELTRTVDRHITGLDVLMKFGLLGKGDKKE